MGRSSNCPRFQTASILRANFAAQMEALLNCHPDIAECAVFGLPDTEGSGNDLTTASVVRKIPSLTADDVKRYVVENASDFKQLRGGVYFVDKIPKVYP
jgi:acyl-coenzyme A synthetase/AMP-(fatty) acid ligase